MQADLFLAFDLDDLAVVYGDFHRTKAQTLQCADNLAQGVAVVLTVRGWLLRCAHGHLQFVAAGRLAVGVERILGGVW